MVGGGDDQGGEALVFQDATEVLFDLGRFFLPVFDRLQSRRDDILVWIAYICQVHVLTARKASDKAQPLVADPHDGQDDFLVGLRPRPRIAHRGQRCNRGGSFSQKSPTAYSRHEIFPFGSSMDDEILLELNAKSVM